jgi:hypothetical protein
MSNRLSDLERRRTELLTEMAQLGYFRRGSISALVRRCGKPGCRCSQPNDPGHGPNFRLTYKINGRTHSESLPNRAAIENAARQIAEFRRFQALTREFVDVNTRICRLLPRMASDG